MHDLKQVQSAFLRNWPISAWPFLMLCCSGGLIKVIYAFGYGYGISMFVQGCLAYFVHKARPGSSLLAASLYACYGLRLTWYLYRRQHDDSFISSTHGQNLEGRMSSTPLMVKLNIVFFVSAVQQATLYVLDMICASRSRRTIRAALSVAFCGLLLEALSDEQKLAAKAENPEMPVTTGLFSIIRHPNYLGEILFWLGVSGACLASSSPWIRRAAFLAGGPLFMCWVMVGAAARLDEDSLRKYREVPGYQEYMAATGSLVPR